MRLIRALVVSVGCFVTIAGCSDDSGADDGSNGNEEGIDCGSVDPPPNIDITSCYEVRYDGDRNGYLSAGYVGFGEEECTCISP